VASVQLPVVPSIGNYRFATAIETVNYIFEVRWNTRDAAWYLNVLESDETPIIYGAKVVLGAYIGRRVDHPLFNDGVLVASDTSGAGLDAGFNDFGTRVLLQYVPILDLVQRISDWSNGT
jgi:hypothetical protein